MSRGDGHVRILPVHVANKIAAGEVVERPASVVKELVENAIDAGAAHVRISAAQGGRKYISVADDGCGMSRDDALLSLERQATSKILDVADIDAIDTLGFRGEAVPSIASVSRFTMTTRRRDSDEGTLIQVNAGVLADVRAAGCPPGTLVEVRDLFCNVPARKKFLRAAATEETHIRNLFTVHALAHPSVGFTLHLDGREAYSLAPCASPADRMRDLFGDGFLSSTIPIDHRLESRGAFVRVSGRIEKPNRSAPARRDQFVFVNSRPATSPAIAYALREAWPVAGSRPAAVIFVEVPPGDVDVNVHPAKREVRFRNAAAVRDAVGEAIAKALHSPVPASSQAPAASPCPQPHPSSVPQPASTASQPGPSAPLSPSFAPQTSSSAPQPPPPARGSRFPALHSPFPMPAPRPEAKPLQVEFAVDPASRTTRPWKWFRYLAIAESGYLLIETDAGIVTVCPQAARERIAFERLFRSDAPVETQPLLIPETVRLAPADAARIRASLAEMASLGFSVEEFGRDVFKIDAVPAIAAIARAGDLVSTIASDLAEGGRARGAAKWREELVAKSVAKSYAGASGALTADGAVRLVEELASCRMPYVSPKGKPTMVFTSNREIDRKFGRD